MAPIQMLWIGDRLSNLERLSITSYLANGHAVHLYTYGEVAGVPPGTTLRDAREILPESAIFTNPGSGYAGGTYAGFSDGFRYKLLLDRGGIWSDADIVCLRPFDFSVRVEYCIALERVPTEHRCRSGQVKMNCCLMQAPAGAAVMRECFEVFAAADKGAVRHAEVGPELVTRKFAEHGLDRFALAPEAICPVDFWDALQLAQTSAPEMPDAYAIHMWNGMWTHHGYDKNARYPRFSAYEKLKKRYGIA